MIWFYWRNRKRSSGFFRSVMSWRIELCKNTWKNDNKKWHMKMIDHNHFICHLILGTFTEYPYLVPSYSQKVCHSLAFSFPQMSLSRCNNQMAIISCLECRKWEIFKSYLFVPLIAIARTSKDLERKEAYSNTPSTA